MHYSFHYDYSKNLIFFDLVDNIIMANFVLFVSSLIGTIIHVFAIFNFPNIDPFYGFILFRGCLSSLYNHGSTNSFNMLYDRTVMNESIIVDIIYMIKIKSLTLIWPLLGAVCLYRLSKLISGNIPTFITNLLHIYAHICITIVHVLIIISF